MPAPPVLLTSAKPDGSRSHFEVVPVPFNKRRHLAQARSWKPVLAAHAQEDLWDWALLLREASTSQNQQDGRFETWALEYQEELQALMMIEIARHRSRKTGTGLVYVEYLAVAPWNRKGI